jgi:glycosyltransferase involved in cell wall biosynthesis
MSHSPLISCVIPTFGREALLLGTIEAVLPQLIPGDELIVVDQNPSGHYSPAGRARIERWRDSRAISWISRSTPNLPAARNEGLRQSKNEIVLFVDDDVFLPPDFVESHRKSYKDPEISAAGGAVLNDRSHPAVMPPHSDLQGTFIEQVPLNWGTKVYTRMLIGCNLSVRRKEALRIGGFDERFMGTFRGEDADFGIRLHRANGRILFDPKIWVRNSGRGTPGGIHAERGDWLNRPVQVGGFDFLTVRELAPEIYCCLKTAPAKGGSSRTRALYALLRGFVLNKRLLVRPPLFLLGCLRCGAAFGWAFSHWVRGPVYLSPTSVGQTESRG